MSRLRSAMVLALIIILALGAAASAGIVSDKLSPADLAKVKSGEIITRTQLNDTSTKGVSTAFMTVRSTPEEFWFTATDFDHFLEFYPRLIKAEVHKKTNRQSLVTYHFDATAVTMVYTLIGTISDDRMRQDWTLDKSKPHKYFKVNDGYWILEQLEPGVLLIEYGAVVELDLGVMTKLATKIVSALTTDDLPESMECTRKRVESGNTWVRNK